MMKKLKRLSTVGLTLLVGLVQACSLLPAVSSELPKEAASTAQAVDILETPGQPGVTTATPLAQPTPEAGSESDQAVLLFEIGVHIEPLGSMVSSLVNQSANQPPAPPQPQPGSQPKRPDNNQLTLFERHVQDLLTVAGIVERHGGKLTVQAQTPFTQVAIHSGNSILADLAANGHEIALHFHEDAHLGRNSTALSPDTWCAVMKEEISLIQQSSGVQIIRYWSGGNLYPSLFEAAACAGLEINSDWKNPKTQSTPMDLTGIHPWRPSGGTDGNDISLFTTHDPNGAVVFLPEGQYTRGDFASMRRSESTGGDQAYFEFLKESLMASLAAAQAGKVNVFHFTIHPGEFRGDPQRPFEVIERFLEEVVDPLVASGQVRWATFSEMADAFEQWEIENPGVEPRFGLLPKVMEVS